MNSTDLAFTSALEQARLIRQQEVSPLELTQLYLKRIERLNPQLGGYVHVAADLAIADAKAKTDALARDQEALPPFFGVPISIKDLDPVAGMPCSYGLRVLKNRIAEKDNGVVTRLKQAGFVILGKTTAAEAGTLPYTEPNGFLPARNPWNLAYTSGGSSGGAAAAVAAGLCPVAQGSDGGGSVRGPAFCCGLVGIKPSRGRVTHAPVGDRLSGAAIAGPLARTVADAAALLDAMAGYVVGDPYWLPDPKPSFLAMTQTPPPCLRIGFTTEVPPVGTADPICKQAVLETAQRLAALGHIVEPMVPLDLTELIEPFCIIFQAVLVEIGAPPFVLSKMNRWWWLQARLCPTGKFMRAVTKMQVIARQIVAQFETIDVLLLPTYMHPSIKVGEWAALRPAATLEKIINWIAPCPPFNASGQPAIAFPTGFAPNCTPIGVQLVGQPAGESTLIALAAQLEAAYFQTTPRPNLDGQGV
jgi:amidase